MAPNIKPLRVQRLLPAAVRQLAALGLGLALAACGTGDAEVFSEATSPDGQWTIRITVAQSRMPQGPFYVAAWLYGADPDAATKLLETTLANDGVPFTDNNIALRWTSSSSALLCLRASDLPDRGVRIEAGPAPRAITVERC